MNKEDKDERSKHMQEDITNKKDSNEERGSIINIKLNHK